MKALLAVSAAVAIPALAFAGSTAITGHAPFGGFGGMMGQGSEFGRGFNMARGTFSNGSGTTVSTKIRDALTASGITLPSDAEIAAANATMKQVTDARKAFKPTDADSAALKAIRDAAAKQERDYLRSKGVTLPAEDAIVQAQSVHEALRKAMETFTAANPRAGNRMMKGKFGGMMGGNADGSQDFRKEGRGRDKK